MNTDQALAGLYPHLADAPQADAAALDAALLESVRQKAAHSVEIKSRFFASTGPQVVTVARVIADRYRRGGRLFTMGNGG